MNTHQAAAELSRLEAQFVILSESEAVYVAWRHLVETFRVSGFRSYDARLVASMLVHGVGHILTFNGPDFARYTGITVVHPEEVR